MLKTMLRQAALGIWYASRILLLFALVLTVGGAIFVRYWILPQIERYHGDIEAAASATIGRPLTVARIEANWEGLRPRLLLSEVSIRDEQGRVALQLPVMRNTVAWSSLLFGELRFHSLQLDNPQLSIRRDQAGQLYVGGIESVPQSSVASGAEMADWLLHQTQIVVRDGRIVWQDDMRATPPIAFEQVELTIDNLFDHHRFTLRASPAPTLATSVELRGDLYGDGFAATNSWRGELVARIDQVDVAAGRTLLELPFNLQQGRGDLQLSLQLVQGAIAQLDAEIDMRELQAQLGAELPILALLELKGRLGWRQLRSGFEISTNDFSLRMGDGYVLPPTNFLLNLNTKLGSRPASGEVRADALNLADVGRLLDYLPLAVEAKQRVANLGLQGRVRNLQASWQGDIEKLLRYQVQAEFEQIAMRQFGKLPEVSGLSGSVDGNDSDGILLLDSRDFRIEAPGFLAEPLQFDRLSGRLDWQHNSQRGWDFKLNNMRVANADLAGNIFGKYQFDSGPGSADLTVNLTRASVRHAARYIPLHAFNDATYRWLQTGLQDGEADSFQLHVRGNLRDFPFADGKTGLFKITAKAKGVAIEFDPGWPSIEQAEADLLIQGSLLEVKASTARTAGAALQQVRVALPDTLAHRLVMEVDGEAADDTQRSLDYVRNSPVSAYLNGYTDGFQAQGKGLLKLHLEIPLGQDAPAKVRGSYRIDDNTLDLGAKVPLLQSVQGELSFSNETIQAEDVTVQILGGPARLALHNDGGTLLVNADGTLDVGSLHADYRYPLLRRLRGEIDWQAKVSVSDKLGDVQVSSDLLGLTSDLPRPFNKSPSQRVNLHFEQKDLDAEQDSLQLRYGEIFDATLLRSVAADGSWAVRRAHILLGAEAKASDKDGIWIAGHLPRLDLQGWSGWSDLPQREGVLPDIAGIDVTLDQVVGFGNSVHDLNIRGSARNGLVSTRLISEEINGDLIWQPQDQGKLLVRLKQLKLGGGEANETIAAPAANGQATGTASMPVVDMAVDNLFWKGRVLGKLALLLEGDAEDVVLKSMRLTNPDALLEANGRWRALKGETQINVKIGITDSGKLLARFGYPDSVSGAKGVFESALTWRGTPDAFNYPSLFGSIRVNVGKGRFLQVDPGAAKLLGVLSLQALPKRIALDFTDVFSPGFQFDNISGLALIENGMLKTEDFSMAGTSAKVTLRGEVDIERETQQLQVRVFPALGDNISLLSFAAGPAVGVGVLIANKILSNPLDKLVSFDYNVSGSWADPVVERIGSSKQSTKK
ncbi:MAG: YhdP family protein [Sideroxyarcus sp.]|nr:YhdP family protein [Sideroxyarcus sp.]